MNDAERAKKLLHSENYTCVLCKDDLIYSSEERGIKPLIDFIDKGIDLNGFSAADKIVGKAAAFLYVILGVKEIYADVMSESAAEVSARYKIQAEYDTLTKKIINRSGTGLCPMEEAVQAESAPLPALEKIRARLELLKQ